MWRCFRKTLHVDRMSILRIAELSGVSPATVSRVFNRPEQVSDATRSRVLQVAAQLGYQPNAAARSLRTQRSRIIGVMLPTLRDPVFAECLEGISSKALREGYGIMPIASGYDRSKENEAIVLLVAANVDGLILTVTDPDWFAPALVALSDQGLPYVLAYNQSPDYVCVGVNSQVEVEQVVHRLIKAGHRKIAMLSGERAASDRAAACSQGYLAAMDRARLPSLPIIEVAFMQTSESAVEAVMTNDRSRPTAMICSNDLLALRFIRQARQLGLDVPADVSVVGFGGIAVGAELSPALSTIAQPSVEIGQRAVELVIAQIHGEKIAAGSEPPMPCSFRQGETIRALG